MKIYCPNCNQKYDIPEGYIGRKGQCEKCNFKFIIELLNKDKYLVDGKHTWESTKEEKHDLAYMKKCCDAELKSMNETEMVAAPAYFERVAILFRKEKNYEQEIAYCKKYIEAVKRFYKEYGTKGIADVRKSPTYEAIVKRLAKAKVLLKKQKTNLKRSK